MMLNLHRISHALKIEIQLHPFARCLEMIRNGDADTITGIAYTKERTEFIDYVKTPYMSVRPLFIARKGLGSSVQTLTSPGISNAWALSKMSIVYPGFRNTKHSCISGSPSIRHIGPGLGLFLVYIIIEHRLAVSSFSATLMKAPGLISSFLICHKMDEADFVCHVT